MKALLGIGLAFALAACNTTGGQVAGAPNPYAKQIDTACVVGTAALQTITLAREANKVTQVQMVQIKPAVDSFAAVCMKETRPSMTEIEMQAFLQAIELMRAKAGAL